MLERAHEQRLEQIAQQSGIGAQFGGKYFALDVRVVRLPRYGASCPVGVGVSYSADRNIKRRSRRTASNPGRFIPAAQRALKDDNIVQIDLNKPMAEIRKELSRHR